VSDFGGTFDPLADTIGAGIGRIDLRTMLLETGVALDDLERADADGTLELLAFERLVNPDQATFDLDEVAALAAVPPESIRDYWRALGFPDPRPGEKLFSDGDLAVLSDVVWFNVHGALGADVALQLARVIGSSLDRIARAQVETIETPRVALDEPVDATVVDVVSVEVPTVDPHPWDGDDEELSEHDQLAIRRGAEMLPLMPKVMDFVWRRHLSDAARRRRLRATTGEGDVMCVGFADLVGYTAQTLQLSEEELAAVVGRFESIAYDVVSSHGGRVVKMIGDEVMFVAEGVRGAAELALALAETYRNEEALSDVRVGLATGPVLEREGDVYGAVVNRASRIVSIAYPGAVVIDDDVHRALAEDDSLVFRSIRQHYLKDIGRVRLWTMRHAGDDEEVFRPGTDRTESRRDFLLSRRAERLASSHVLSEGVEQEVVELLEDAGLLHSDQLERALTSGEEPTLEFEAISDVVLEADIDDDLQIELLADLEVARRLAELEREAQRKAEEADDEAEQLIQQLEAEARRRVTRIEADARRMVSEVLAEAERRAAQVNEEASRKVRKVADEAERKATEAEREAQRAARKKKARHKAERQKADKDGTSKSGKKRDRKRDAPTDDPA